MALTPEEIEGRQFPLVARGYDPKLVDRFLTEVAASYRYAMHHLLPGVARSQRPDADRGADQASHERIGAEVTDILRAAERVADSLRSEAERQATELRSTATAQADEIRAEAERERQQAKKALLRAQEQAEALVRDAERQAQQRLAEVEAEAEQRADRLLSGVRRRAEQMVRAEAAAVQRLRAVRDDIEAAIVRVAGSETEPVVDLTSGEPVVRIGDFPPPETLDGEAAGEPAVGEPDHVARIEVLPADPHRRPGPDRRRDLSTEEERDSLRRMVRAAVLRAAEHSAVETEGETADGAAGGTGPDEQDSAGDEAGHETAKAAAGGRADHRRSPAPSDPSTRR